MNRKNAIKKLLDEGFSVKTLSNLNDKQIKFLSDRILQEQSDDNAGVMKVKSGSPEEETLKQKEQAFIAYEQEDDGENHDEGDKELDKEPTWLKAMYGINPGLAKQAEEYIYNLKNNIEPSINELNENNGTNKKVLKHWVENLVENNYSVITTKNEITEILKKKLDNLESEEELDHEKEIEYKEKEKPDDLILGQKGKNNKKQKSGK